MIGCPIPLPHTVMLEFSQQYTITHYCYLPYQMLYRSPGVEMLQPAFSLEPIVYDIGPRGEHVHSYARLEIRTVNQLALFSNFK
jgi:hypothetical protein